MPQGSADSALRYRVCHKFCTCGADSCFTHRICF